MIQLLIQKKTLKVTMHKVHDMKQIKNHMCVRVFVCVGDDLM